MQENRSLKFSNGLELDLVLCGDRFLGIGTVRHAGVPLRSSALPWTIYAELDAGFRYDRFQLIEIKASSTEAMIRLHARAGWLPRVQEADAMGDSRIRSRRLDAPVAEVRWNFRIINEEIYENTWSGLAMQIEVDTPGHPVHWLLEDATWEIGGEAHGCTLIQQDIMAQDLEQRVERSSVFSTHECFEMLTDGEWEPNYPMDMMPRGVGAGICDFQVKDDIVICLFSERPGMTRARLEKHEGEDVIHYLDRPFFPLTEHAVAPERKLLVYRHPWALKRHEWRNLWLDCFTEVRRRIHEGYGFALQIPEPAVSGHLWDPQLMEYGAAWVDRLIEGFPLFERLGYKGLYTHGGWEGATTDPDAHGNICTPYAFRNDDAFGGPQGMRRLTDAAHRADIEVFHWAGLQYSKFAPIWKEHPEWILQKANGEPWDAGYKILQCGRMRSGFRDHIFEQLKTARNEAGLDGIFWDSFHNLGSTCIDWGAPDKAPQLDEIIRFQVALQEIGYKHRCEVITIFGISQVGMYSFKDDTFRRRLWENLVANDEAFALLDTSPAFHSHEYAYAAGRADPEAYFWLLAHRVVPALEMYAWAHDWDLSKPGWGWPGRELAEAYGAVNRIYNRVLPQMQRLRLVEGGTHTVWLDHTGAPAVIWAFEKTEVEHTGTLTDVNSGDSQRADGRVSVEPGHVYLLQEAAAPAVVLSGAMP